MLGAMDAADLMSDLATVIDAHDWDRLPALLHDDFTCRYVHTGEQFDRATWVHLNACYPGFDRFTLKDCVATTDRAAARAHVTGYVNTQLRHFEVATFITVHDGLIADMTEVWTDVDQDAPQGTRPS
jgi:hypothetical protein